MSCSSCSSVRFQITWLLVSLLHGVKLWYNITQHNMLSWTLQFCWGDTLNQPGVSVAAWHSAKVNARVLFVILAHSQVHTSWHIWYLNLVRFINLDCEVDNGKTPEEQQQQVLQSVASPDYRFQLLPPPAAPEWYQEESHYTDFVVTPGAQLQRM